MSLESERRYDIDWLRVIVFGVLILYHVGMMYVSWGWHIKSTYILPWLENVMRLSNPWRLPLLFLISGLAMSFVFGKMPLGRLMRLRAVRLMIPLMVGVTVIVPPQIYYQSLARGYIEPGYLSFLGLYFTSNPVLNDVTPTYTHLWFVAYLMIYSVVALPVFLGMIFGLIEVGRVMYANDALSNATRAAIRFAMVRGSTSETPATAADIADTLRAQATALLPANLQVTTTFVPDNNPGSTVTIQATYTHDYLLPFLPLEQITLRSESTMTVAR